jgi:hypothetical protein
VRTSGFAGWIDRGWAAWVSRSRRFRLLVALAMVIPLLASVPFVFGGHDGPALPTTASAHGVRDAHYPKRAKPRDAAAKNAKPGSKDLPSGGSGTASFDRERLTKPGATQTRVTAHGTPVWARPVVPRSGPYRGPSQVAVKVADRKTAAAAGVNGVLFSAQAKGGAGPVVLGVDYR